MQYFQNAVYSNSQPAPLLLTGGDAKNALTAPSTLASNRVKQATSVLQAAEIMSHVCNILCPCEFLESGKRGIPMAAFPSVGTLRGSLPSTVEISEILPPPPFKQLGLLAHQTVGCTV